MVMVSNISKYSVLGDFQEIWLINVISFQFFVVFFYVVAAFFLIKKGKIRLVTLQNNMKNNILNNKTIFFKNGWV